MSGELVPNPAPQEGCVHPDHDRFPMHMVIPPGKAYRHVCDGCGKVMVLRGSQVRWSA